MTMKQLTSMHLVYCDNTESTCDADFGSQNTCKLSKKMKELYYSISAAPETRGEGGGEGFLQGGCQMRVHYAVILNMCNSYYL